MSSEIEQAVERVMVEGLVMFTRGREYEAAEFATDEHAKAVSAADDQKAALRTAIIAAMRVVGEQAIARTEHEDSRLDGVHSVLAALDELEGA